MEEKEPKKSKENNNDDAMNEMLAGASAIEVLETPSQTTTVNEGWLQSDEIAEIERKARKFMSVRTDSADASNQSQVKQEEVTEAISKDTREEISCLPKREEILITNFILENEFRLREFRYGDKIIDTIKKLNAEQRMRLNENKYSAQKISSLKELFNLMDKEQQQKKQKKQKEKPSKASLNLVFERIDESQFRILNEVYNHISTTIMDPSEKEKITVDFRKKRETKDKFVMLSGLVSASIASNKLNDRKQKESEKRQAQQNKYLNKMSKNQRSGQTDKKSRGAFSRK